MKKRTGWIACSIVLLMFGYLACNSFAAEEDKNKALSKAISQVKLFSGLTEPERDALKEVAVLKHGKPGERIIQEGQSMGRMLIILDSQAEVRIKGKLIATLLGQTLVGEIEFLDMGPATADVVLLKETELIELNNTELNSLMEKNPRIGYTLMREIAKIEAQRLRNTSQKQ